MNPKHPWIGLVVFLVVCFAAAGIGGGRGLGNGRDFGLFGAVRYVWPGVAAGRVRGMALLGT